MIVVDSKEASNKNGAYIVEHLKSKGYQVDVQSLPVGDYYLIGASKKVIVERKTCWDYVHSVASRRMIDQLLKLVNVEDAQPMIIVEGSIAMIKKFSKWSDDGVAGSLASTILDWDVQVVFTPSRYWSAVFIAKLMKNIGTPKEEKFYPLRVKPKLRSDDERIRCVVEGIEDIGPSLADALLRRFKTIENLCAASIEDLKSVPKIGDKTAQKIHYILHYPYKGKCEE
jgi:ERCC4-type nuclease